MGLHSGDMSIRPVPFYGDDATKCVCPNCEEVVEIPVEHRSVTIPPLPPDTIGLRAFHQCNPAHVAGRIASGLSEMGEA